jgi:hypothetical protein
VVRDDEARPPREALPLRIPVAPGDEPAAESAEEATEPTEPSRRAEDLKPFERGPEITEVR